MRISVVIPTLNEELSLAATLTALADLHGVFEVIVVDGNSADKTREIAERFGARIVVSKSGRGLQLSAGARAARGDAFWFLHADTLPPQNACEEILRALENPEIVGGNFEIRFDGNRRAAKLLTRLYPKLRALNLCYGDSAFFVRREIYQKVGGFAEMPLFEDVDFYRKAKKHGRFVHLKSFVTSSSRRFEKRSFALTFARWSLFQGLYWLGLPPAILARYYEPIRK